MTGYEITLKLLYYYMIYIWSLSLSFGSLGSEHVQSQEEGVF